MIYEFLVRVASDGTVFRADVLRALIGLQKLSPSIKRVEVRSVGPAAAEHVFPVRLRDGQVPIREAGSPVSAREPK
jgi:hypothetical protein